MRRKRLSGIALPLALVAVAVLAIPAHGAFPGANGKIAFDRYDGAVTGETTVYTVNPDGTGLTPLANGADPAWSPDGKKIAFLRGNFGFGGLSVMNADGTGQVPLTTGAGGVTSPSWLPDGSKIVFHREPGGSFSELWGINPDGTGETRLLYMARGVRDPVFSPDASKIAYWATDGIDTIDADGTNPIRLSEDPALEHHDRYPSWSPDGSEISFGRNAGSSDLGSHYRIWRMSSQDGSNDVLDADAGSQSAWSPDRSKLVVADVESCRDDPDRCPRSWPLLLTNVDGSATGTPLTSPSFQVEDRNPDWQPLRAYDPYPRPGSGTPLRVPFVPAYAACDSPNSMHVEPLDLPSCDPPRPESEELTVRSEGFGSGSARFRALPGDPSTAADEADVHISALASDVRTKGGPDYSGEVILSATIRITDRRNGFGDVAGTVSDLSLQAPAGCIPTLSPIGGSVCSIDTTADTLLPGIMKERARTVMSLLSVELLDAGADGSVGDAGDCPPKCGTGDENVFLRQGVFAP